jgi:DNA-binding CsgD family transcriptional regulator
MSNGEIEPLSEREMELVELLGQGLSNREIAQNLFISPNTVKVHLRNIYAKLHVSSRTEATMVALRQGLIEIELPGQEDETAESSAATAAQETPDEQPAAHAQPLRLWQHIYLVASVLLVALGFWLTWPRVAQQTGPFPGPQPMGSRQPPGTTSRWSALAQLSKPRRRHAIAVQGNRVYAIGGETSQGITGAVEIYDPETDDWNPGADKPSPAADIGAVVLGDRIYCPGGILADGTFSDLLELYAPEQDGPGRWTTGTPLPYPTSAYASAAHGNALYLFGGWDGTSYSDATLKYDPAAKQWSVLRAMPTPRAYAGAGTVGDRIYVVGGYDGQAELDTCQVYDPLLDQWDTCPPLNAPRGGAGVAVVEETLYVIGGGWKSYLVANEYLTLSGDTPPSWKTFPSPLLQEWRNLGVAANGTFIYAVGGWDGEFMAVNQAYRALFRIYLPSLEEQDKVINQGTPK